MIYLCEPLAAIVKYVYLIAYATFECTWKLGLLSYSSTKFSSLSLELFLWFYDVIALISIWTPFYTQHNTTCAYFEQLENMLLGVFDVCVLLILKCVYFKWVTCDFERRNSCEWMSVLGLVSRLLGAFDHHTCVCVCVCLFYGSKFMVFGSSISISDGFMCICRCVLPTNNMR